MRISIFLFVLMPIFLSCSIETEEKIGPNGSWWLGGEDGGVFVKIQEDANLEDEFYQGVIYFDGNKNIWYKGEFKLVGDINFSPDDHGQYQFWDGEKLYLKNSAYLEPTSPIPQL